MVVFSQRNELSGYDITRSPTGWIVSFWSRIPDDINGDSYIYYYDAKFDRNCDFNQPYDDLFSVGDALAIIVREDLERYRLRGKCLSRGKVVPYRNNKKGEHQYD